MIVKIKRTDTAMPPARADSGAAGYDLYADMSESEINIAAGETVFIDTGLIMEIPEGYWGALYARSGLACKQGLRLANCVGVIDSSYRGSVKAALHNSSNTTKTIKHNDRIAQLIIHKCHDIEFAETEELTTTGRGIGGFGSSGV